MRPTIPSNRRVVTMDWLGDGLKFRGRGSEPESPEVIIDGDSEQGPSPMLALLLAAGGCSGSDVVHILTKMRQPPTALSIEVSGLRRDEEPKRFVDLHMLFKVRGEDLDRSKVEHAVSLSIEKYCSVVHSLAPDIAVSYDIEIA